jgi:hypothetical protein
MAISFIEGLKTSTSTPAFTIAVAVGDLLVFGMNNSASGLPTVTITDSTNTGGWTAGQYYYNSFWGVANCFLYKVCNQIGTPTLSITSSIGIGAGQMAHFSGFNGTATLIGTDQAIAGNSGSTSTAVNSGSFNAAQNSELCIGYSGQGAGYSVSPTTFGWTEVDFSSSTDTMFYQIGVAQSTSISLQGTLGSAADWISQVQGFYDNQAGGISVAWLS